jgi:hypothetical protein
MDIAVLRSLCARALQSGSSGDVFNMERHTAENILQLCFPKFNGAPTPPIQLNPNVMRDFEQLLASTPKSPDDAIKECISILGTIESPLQSESVYVVVYLVTYLQALVQAQSSVISAELKSNLGEFSLLDYIIWLYKYGLVRFILGFLYQRPKCPHFIVASITKLYGLLLKVGWFEGDFAISSDMETMKKVCTDFYFFIMNQIHTLMYYKASLHHWVMAHQIMAIMIAELNSQQPFKNPSKYRKVAVLFRDEHLIKLFKSLLESLSLLIAKSLPFESVGKSLYCLIS